MEYTTMIKNDNRIDATVGWNTPIMQALDTQSIAKVVFDNIDEFESMVDKAKKLKELKNQAIEDKKLEKFSKLSNISFQPPLTIAVWEDGVKTFVRCADGDEFDPEKGAALAIAKRYFKNDYNFIDNITYFVDKYYKKNPKAETCTNHKNCECKFNLSELSF